MVLNLGRIFPVHQFARSSKAIRILTISDTLFFSGIELAALVFAIFVVDTIPGATVVELGIASALFYTAIFLTEPAFAKIYDSADSIKASYYGLVLGNFLKSIARVAFAFLTNVPMFYMLFFFLGVVHGMEFPSFAKLFTHHIDKGSESFEWSYKDSLASLGKIAISLASGYIVVLFSFKALFFTSALIMFVFGVLLPLYYKKDLIGE